MRLLLAGPGWPGEAGLREEMMTAELSLEEYRSGIERYIAGLIQDPGQAEDLVQETFLKACRSRESLRDPAALKAWLYRIATNVCYDHFRRSASLIVPLPADQEIGGPSEGTWPEREEPGIEALIARGEMSRCVQKIIGWLPEKYRAVILLHDIHGLTNHEIAQVLDCSLEAAKIHLHRARRKLKEVLLRECEFSHDDRGVFVCRPKPADR